MGWDALRQWGRDAQRLHPLSGGTENDVWEVCVAGQRAVARLGTRSAPDLLWEVELLRYLAEQGFTVPMIIPTQDGAPFADGLLVMTFVDGDPPETEEDWQRVAATLQHLHKLTRTWPQRPGWRSSQDLIHEDSGTRVDLRLMPKDGVARCRAAWAKLAGRSQSVVHGDPNAANIKMTGQTVGLIDWDEARRDVCDLDLVLPHGAGGLSVADRAQATQALSAWEATVCWGDDYALKRLAEVDAP